jgi:predicted aspartyl protease
MAALIPAIALLLGSGYFPATHYPATHGASGAQEASEIDIVATRDDRHERLTVPVRIGGQGTFRFLIDTGAQNTVVSHDLADRLALTRGEPARVVGVIGEERAQTVVLDEIGLGRRTYQSMLAPLLDARDIGADGILGIDSLQDQRVLIDFTRGLIAIDEARYLGGDTGFEIVVKARRRLGQLIMTSARIDGVPVDVIIDTGAQASIGNRALQRALARRHRSGAPAAQSVLSSVTGDSVLADVGSAGKLDLGEVEIGNVSLAYVDSPAFTALGLDARPALLLGMRELRVFRRVAIDFASRKVLFDIPE